MIVPAVKGGIELTKQFLLIAPLPGAARTAIMRGGDGTPTQPSPLCSESLKRSPEEIRS